MHDRDKEVVTLQKDVAALRSEMRELKTLMQESITATQKRFEQDEKHTMYLREAVAGIHSELRVRFGSTSDATHSTDRAMRTLSRVDDTPKVSISARSFSVAPVETHSTPEKLDLIKLAAKTDRSLVASEKSVPAGKPLEKVRLF